MGSDLPYQPLHLTPNELGSPLWQRIAQHFEIVLQQLRIKNEAVMPEAERGAVLGEIAAVRKVLDLGKRPPTV